jgi:hypothetical protein
VFFSQEHRPGEAAQTDFTHATELAVTFVGVAFDHIAATFSIDAVSGVQHSGFRWMLSRHARSRMFGATAGRPRRMSLAFCIAGPNIYHIRHVMLCR